MKYLDKLNSTNILFKNRIIMPPMATSKSDDNGHVTDECIKYYEEKTRNNKFSAVILEHSYVEKRGQAHLGQTSISDDSDIDGMSKLAKIIKNNGSLAILQLAHAGSAAKEEIIGVTPIAPSAIPNPARPNSSIPRELSIKEIKEIEDKFVEAALRAKKSGFDGVEIHSAHGYLLNQFLSPLSNTRNDEYGGDINGRIKLHLDIIKRIKRELGSSYPVFIRIGAGDFCDGGLSEQDSIDAAIAFEKAGVDVIDISGGMCLYTIKDTRPGYFDTISKPIFDNVDIPVILTGGIKSKKDVIDVLDRNVCDLVGIGRAVLKNSNWFVDEGL